MKLLLDEQVAPVMNRLVDLVPLVTTIIALLEENLTPKFYRIGL